MILHKHKNEFYRGHFQLEEDLMKIKVSSHVFQSQHSSRKKWWDYLSWDRHFCQESKCSVGILCRDSECSVWFYEIRQVELILLLGTALIPNFRSVQNFLFLNYIKMNFLKRIIHFEQNVFEVQLSKHVLRIMIILKFIDDMLTVNTNLGLYNWMF